MTELTSITTPPPEPPTPPRRRRRFFTLKTGLGFALLFLVAATSLVVWVKSSSCENLVRKELIARIGSSTGGRVEIAAFHWKPFRLQAVVDGLVIHGLETASEAPYARVQRLSVQLSIFGFLSPRILLRNLDVDQPSLHLIVYPDGSTNQPRPRSTAKASRPVLDTLFDLRAGHIAVFQGILDYENRAASFDYQHRFQPLDFTASQLALRVVYVPPATAAPDGNASAWPAGKNPEYYRIEFGARDLDLTRGAPLHPVEPHVSGFVQATLDLTRSAAYLRTLRLTARGRDADTRTLVIAGAVSDFKRPRWQATMQGDLDMRLLEPVTGYTDTPEGFAHLDLTAVGDDGQFRIDGTIHAKEAAYVGSGVTARGVDLDARVHADPEQLLITSIVARLQQGGQLEGSVTLDHWLPPVPGSSSMQAAPPLPIRNGRASRTQPPAPEPRPVNPADVITIPVTGKVNAQLRDVPLDAVLDIVSKQPFQRLGFGALLNGPATATWVKGDDRTLAVGARLVVSPATHPLAGEVPVTGIIDGTYTQRNGAVDLRQLNITMPASHVEARGHLGTYPLTSPTDISVTFRSHDLREFDEVLRDLGLRRHKRTGAAALPVSLAGEADLEGTWTGSLADPHIAGSLQATNLVMEMPPREGESPDNPERVHWDALEAAGSFSTRQISIDRAELRRGPASIHLQGTLTAEQPAAKSAGLAYDANSMLHARVSAAQISMGELLPVLGQNLPVTGQFSAQFEADGPLHSLNGVGWLQLDNGTVYGETINHIRTQGKVTGPLLQLSSVNVNDQGGRLSAAGTYNFQSHQFQLDAQCAGIDLSRINRIRQSNLGITGKLTLNVTGKGTLDDPQIQSRGTITNVSLRGEQLGNVVLTAHTAQRALIYDLTSHFETAELTAHGQTSLDSDHQTQTTLHFAHFDIGAPLRMAQVPGLTGESSLAGTVTVEGPLARPHQLRGEARLQQLAMTIAGVHLQSEGPVHAALVDERITLDPLHVVGEQTDLRAQGTVDFKARRQLDLAASGSINLKLIETLDPDLTASGITTFEVRAHGTLQDPGLTGRIDFQNASLALEDLPNSLSQLHGTLVFNQNRLEVRSLIATTGGGQLSVGGYLAYQHGIYANLTATGKGIRIRYPQGVSSLADANLRLQGTRKNLLLSGSAMITRFTVSPDLDIAALAAQATKIQPIPSPDAPSNHVRLDFHILSSPQLNFQNAYAKLAGNVDLRVRGTLAAPSILGRISVTEGSATIAGTRYDLQRGDITFTNPVHILPVININATARVQDYDITLGIHGPPRNLSVSYRSDPPLPPGDIIALLTLGRTQDQERLYTQQQEQATGNPATDALLGGALNATVSSRVQKIFGAGSVKVDPNYLGVLGNSTTRITVEEQLGRNVILTYATDVDTTAQQLLQAEIAINRHISVLVAHDESGVFSMVIKATRRYR